MNGPWILGDKGIRAKFRLLAGITVAGFAIFATLTFITIGEIHAGGPAFLRNRIAGDVSRDFGASSQTLLSADSMMFQGRAVLDRADVERLRSTLPASRMAMAKRRRHYLEVLDPGRLRDLITGPAYDTAESWFTIAEQEYLPALESGDLEHAEAIRREKLEPEFNRNMAVNEEIRGLADQWILSNRRNVADQVRRRTWQLAAAGAATFLIQFLLGLAIDLRVGSSTRQLETTLDDLRRKSAEVEAFVYIVSHDLRAPLVNLQGFVRELETGCGELKTTIGSLHLPEELDASIGRTFALDIDGSLHFIRAASNKFERLIDSLLLLSRQGREPYRPAPIDTRSLVEGALATLRPLIEQSQASIVVEELPVLEGDGTALRLVLTNLIANALKYRDPARPVVVNVGGQKKKDRVEVWIRDNGVGVPAAGVPRLFKVFQRLRPDLAPGEGMGLAIAQRIVERHAGRIWAESREGEGSTFYLSLPAQCRTATQGV